MDKFVFKRPKPLIKPISVGNKWLRRNYYMIRLISKNSNSKFRTYFSDYDIRFNLRNIPVRLLRKVIHWCFSEILYIIANNTKTFHKYGLTRVCIQSPRLESAVNMESVCLTKVGAQQIMDNIEKLIQSDNKIFLDEGFVLSVHSSDIPIKC